jgi:hypothetical protein
MTIFYLAKQGYGSLSELRAMDTKEFLDLVEYEQISSAIERHHIKEARKSR